MLHHCLYVGFFCLAGAVRFHDLIPDGETHFHGVPVEKYVSSWNRLMEIGHKLNGNTDSFVRFEDLDWDQENPRANPFLYQGDIVLSEEQLDYLVESYEAELAAKEKRHFSHLYSISNPNNLWDPSQFPIPWSIDVQDRPAGGVAAIRKGLALWEESTCVTFEQNGAGQDGHLKFFNGGGCFSSTGKSLNGPSNNISIGRGCESSVTIAHEVGHSLGLFHTQNRNDAGQYIDFFMQNVLPGGAGNFGPRTPAFMPTTRGIPYDYGSAMQYDRFSFAKKKGLATMLPKDRNYNNTMGEDFEIAFTDAKEINMMYCDHICPKKLPCLRGGYTDPKDCTKCRCPSGFGGKFCQRLAETHRADCGDDFLVATSEYQTLAASGNKNCIYRIKAPQGKTIEMILTSAKFQGGHDGYKSCESARLEIKYGAQFQTAGARFCPFNLIKRKVMKSLTNDVLVLYNAFTELSFPNFSFSLLYKIEGGDDRDPCVSPMK